MRDDDIHDITYPQIIFATVVGVPIFIFFEHRAENFIGFLSASSVGGAIIIGFILREFIRMWQFWAVMAVVGLLHAVIIYYFPVRGDFRFGLAYLPFFFADAYATARLIIWSSRNIRP